ncbi:hypothetical protein HNP02_008509 [Mycobacterium sp. AZCC_0083]|nr:hypothetical protein [Mycobacterium sp. AZCC_0083]
MEPAADQPSSSIALRRRPVDAAVSREYLSSCVSTEFAFFTALAASTAPSFTATYRS